MCVCVCVCVFVCAFVLVCASCVRVCLCAYRVWHTFMGKQEVGVVDEDDQKEHGG